MDTSENSWIQNVQRSLGKMLENPQTKKKQQIIADPKGYIDISYFNFLVASSCILIWFASFSLLYSQDMRKKFVYKTRCAANSVR
jgi:hypothetical protein